MRGMSYGLACTNMHMSTLNSTLHWPMVLFCTEQESDLMAWFAEQFTCRRPPSATEEQFSFRGPAIETGEVGSGKWRWVVGGGGG